MNWSGAGAAADALINVWRCKPEGLDYNGDGLIDLVTLDHEGYLSLFLRRQGDDGEIPWR